MVNLKKDISAIVLILHDPLDIAEKINKIVENYSELSQNAIQAYKKFSWDILAEEYIAIYKSIV